MRMNDDYWYPFYPVRFQRDTLHLSPEADGAYRRLIDHYMMTQEPLPDNDVALSRVMGLPCDCDSFAIAKSFFAIAEDGKLHSKMCDRMIAEQKRRKENKKKAGKKGAKKRWEKQEDNGSTKGEAMAPPMANDSTIHNSTEHNNTEDKDIKISSSSTREEEDFYFCESEGRFKGISDSDLELWAKEYPKLDLQAAIADAEKWIRTHGGQLKKQSPRDFLVGWFGNKRTEAPKEPVKLSDSDRYSRYCWNTVRNIPIPAGGDKWMEKYEAREPANAKRIKENCEKMYQERHKSG